MLASRRPQLWGEEAPGCRGFGPKGMYAKQKPFRRCLGVLGHYFYLLLGPR